MKPLKRSVRAVKDDRLIKLIAFLKALEKKTGHKFNIEKLEDRLLIQKIVYIARYFGIDLGYHFDRYLRGPYSTELADDYYKLLRKRESDENG